MNHIAHFDMIHEDNDGDGDGDDEDDNYDGGSEDEDDDEDDDDDDDDDSSEDHIPGPEGGGRSLKGGGVRQISTNSARGTVHCSAVMCKQYDVFPMYFHVHALCTHSKWNSAVYNGELWKYWSITVQALVSLMILAAL